MTKTHEFAKVRIADRHQQPVAELVIRKGTADERSARSVIVDRSYDISRLKRCDELRSVHQNMLETGRKPLIVDLGANIGVSALYLNIAWPESLIVAVEPELNNYHLLVQNTADKPNIRAIHAGIAATDGALSILDPSAETDAYKTALGHGEIPALSMPTLLGEHGGDPFICKIDIEGAERDLFSRDTEWIDLFPLIMIELHDWMLCGEAASQTFLRAVSRHKPRDFVFYGDTVFSIRC